MRKLFLYCSVFFLSLAALVAVSAVLIYNSQHLDAYKLENKGARTAFYDDKGDLITSTDETFDVAKAPEHIKWAFICVEDKDFYRHKGISYNRVAKAAYKNIESKKTKEGASTISQQLIKNTHLTPERTMKRKVREAALAIKLEKQYSKDQILNMYLDAVYFGNGITGISNASHFYYNKGAQELTIREAAGLAGMLRSPGRFNPLTNPVNFTDRTNFVLNMMYNQCKITKDEYQSARTQDLTIHGKRDSGDASAYLNAAIEQVKKLCGDNGYKVYTFFDAEVQTAINEVANTPDYAIKTVSGKTADTCIISATPNGQINALHTNNKLVLNAKRNFASTLKPLVVYAPAIERGVVTPDTVIMDTPYVAGDFHPKNHDDKFRGEVTVRESLANSYNVPAVKVLEYTGLANAVDIGRGLGLNLSDDESLALALGATTNGVTAMELLGGFCGISNGGFLTMPSFIKRVENKNGDIIWQYMEPHKQAISKRVLSNNTCLTVTDMLRETVKSGTAKKMASLDFDIVAKTGTTERGQTGTNTDAVNISYTPSRVLLVWNGNASMKPENDLPKGSSGGGLTTFIARDIQKAINKGDQKFEKPEPIKLAEPVSYKPEKLSITLRGSTGSTGAPALGFNTVAGKQYKIYKCIGGTVSLMEVIKANGNEYNFVDSTAPKQTIIEYHVMCGEVMSNTIKIYTARDINTNAQKDTKSKHWYF